MDPAQGLQGIYDLQINNGIVANVAPNIDTGGKNFINVHNLLVIPGLVDMHTHLREPGFEEKETVATAARAAAAGGYSSITAMPNTNPVMDSKTIVEHLTLLAMRAGLVRIWPVGAISKGSRGVELAEIEEMVRAGARAVTDDGRGVANDGLLREAMLYCKNLGIPLLEHCEDEALAGEGQMHEGQLAIRLGLPGIPAAAESAMLIRDLRLAAETGARLHVMHLSSSESVKIIRQAKADGVPVTAEVTPHHLLLTEEAVIDLDARAKMKPPLRSAADRQALCEGLRDGTIDIIATDHAPHTAAEKSRGFRDAPFGVVGLETAFPVLFTNLVRTGFLTLSSLVGKMSRNPAAILGIPHGGLAPGMAADLTIIDLKKEYILDSRIFHSRGKNTPFDGWRVYGRPVLTLVGGYPAEPFTKIFDEVLRTNGQLRNIST